MDGMKPIKVGKLFKQEISFRPSAILGVMVMWILFSILGLKAWKWRPQKAVTIGFLATFIHFISEWWHQMGHAQAAQQTGYPMQGIEFWGPLSASKYPENEGLLSPDTHIQRALGGPIFSISLAALTALLAVLLRPLGGAAFLLAIFAAVDNFFILTIGALTPLGFTDGSTLLKWWGRSSKQKHIRIDQ